ncbi:YfhJ family protein [Fictibacillus nanhaiensis]|uniref:YfhJ family protein n=1 Tax=Fictibacillus nanhaiensis TaxID=742169 RepID=UPI001C964616|nr:YfhJ family protein [Fictibacillus nanhaiensis]MBY6038380.1 YfhJ family protein [Fictibacillus nanhaiensis]
MEERFDRLAKLLQKMNTTLSDQEAREWVEGLWEDFESTRAKAGREYEGQEVTEKMVTQLITSYGHKLHEYVSTNPKFQRFIKKDGPIN